MSSFIFHYPKHRVEVLNIQWYTFTQKLKLQICTVHIKIICTYNQQNNLKNLTLFSFLAIYFVHYLLNQITCKIFPNKIDCTTLKTK